MTSTMLPTRTNSTGGPAATALALAAREEMWRPAVRFDPDARVHTRIWTGADAEAWLLTWLPGQSTPVHDHGGSAGALLVLAGTLSEWTPWAGDRVTGRGGRTATHLAGELREFGPEHVHEVDNRGRIPAVSLHVYAPRLRSMTRYEVLRGRLRPLGVDRAGAGW